jgi:hypothetical protein
VLLVDAVGKRGRGVVTVGTGRVGANGATSGIVRELECRDLSCDIRLDGEGVM